MSVIQERVSGASGEPVRAWIAHAGELESLDPGDGDKRVPRAMYVTFDSIEDFQKAVRGENVSFRWFWDRPKGTSPSSDSGASR